MYSVPGVGTDIRRKGKRMRSKVLLALLLFGSSLAIPVAAATDATPEHAKQIGDELAVYLGRGAIETGALSVTPVGEDYRIDINLDHVAAALAVPGLKVKMSWSVLATPNADGSWRLRSDAMAPISLTLPLSGGEQTLEMTPQSYHYDAIFDPHLGAIIKSSATLSRLTTVGTGPHATSKGDVEGIVMETSAIAPDDGLVSVKLRDAEENSQQTSTFSTPAGSQPTMPPFKLAVSRGASVINGNINSFRNRAFLDLWAFMVAHPGVEALKSAQDELRSKLRAMLPLWDSLDMAATAQDFALEATGNSLSAKSLGVGINASGITTQSDYAFALNLDGITANSAFLPPWVKPFLPTLFAQSLKFSGLDLDAVSRYAIDNFDLNSPTAFSPAQLERIDAIVLDGKPKLSFGPSRIKAPAYDVTFSGSALLSTPRRAHVTIEAANFEETLAAAQSAADSTPSLASFVQYLVLAQKLSRKGPIGSTVWDVEVEFGEHPSVTINGQSLAPAPKQPN
jgi:hypothetical protein